MRIGEFELQEPLPELRDPHAIAILRPWIDAGNVGTLTLFRLEKALAAKEIGRLATPGDFYDFTRYRPMTHTVEGRRVLSIPNTVISYAHGTQGRPDMLLLRVLEPHAAAERYLGSLLELLVAFGVKRHCRIGAMYDAVPHTRPIRVTGSLNGAPLNLRGIVSRTRRAYEGPTTVLGLLADELSQAQIENMTLMARLPQYLQMEDDYSGAARMLEILSDLYQLDIELPEVERGKRQYRQVDVEMERHGPSRELLQRLEAMYDADGPAEETEPKEEKVRLSPEVQRFLRALDLDDQE